MLEKNPNPITVGELVDFLNTLPREMKICCLRYSDMMYQEMPEVVKGIPHATYIEKLNLKRWTPDKGYPLSDLDKDIPITNDYLLFAGNQ